MGINKLNVVVERELGEVTKPYPISDFAGCRIAIDLSIIVHKCHNKQFRKLADGIDLLNESCANIDDALLTKMTVRDVLARIKSDFVRHSIQPVIVVDGESPELKKRYAGPKRKQAKESAKKRLRALLARLKQKGVRRGNISTADFEELVKIHYQTREMGRDVLKKVAEALEAKNYPVLHAVSEAEELCTKLCLEGKVKAVYSTDTDNIVRRCPLMITNICREGPIGDWSDGSDVYAHAYGYNPLIHERMGLNYEEFVDFCIMMGCDYNQRMKGMREWHIVQYLFFYGSIEK